MTKRSGQVYDELLREYRNSPCVVSSELKKQLNQKLAEISLQKQTQKSVPFRIKPVFAFAASIIAIIAACLVFNTFKSDRIERKLIYESSVAQGKPVTVKLIYNAEDDFENVKFSLNLDNGVSFFTQLDEIKIKKSHEWTGTLKKGVNTIPFVVETDKLGKMKIVARAEYGNFSHIQEIFLDAKESSIAVSMFLINPVPVR